MEDQQLDLGRPQLSHGGPVLLLHGMGRTGASMAALSLALGRRGHPTLAPSYNWRRPLGPLAEWLAPRVEAFARQHAGPLHIVTHSLGGLVARALIAAHRPPGLGRVVMLAPPHGGSGLADALARLRLDRVVMGGAAAQLVTRRGTAEAALLGPVDYPLGIIAGNRPTVPVPRTLLSPPHDGKVSVEATRLPGMADHIVLPLAHPLMPLHPAAIRQVLAFLDTGAFRR